MTTHTDLHLTRVLENALDNNANAFGAEHVEHFSAVRKAATEAARKYDGLNTFASSLCSWLNSGKELTTKQAVIMINIAYSDARAARSTAQANAGEPVYMDLRSTADRLAGEASTVAAELPQGSVITPKIPNGTYTVLLVDRQGNEQGYRTLKVKKAPPNFKAPQGSQLVLYLSGPDNSNDYQAFATISGATHRLWQRYAHNVELGTALSILLSDPMSAARNYVLRSSECFVCGHKLTTPESLRLGIGPICLQNVNKMGYEWTPTPIEAEHSTPVAVETPEQRAARHAKADQDMAELFPD